MKGAMSIEQIALACSGPPLSCNMLNACSGRVAYVSKLMSLQQHGQTLPDKSSDLYHSISYIERGAFRFVDQKCYAPRPSNFVNVSIWCTGTFPYISHVRHRNVRHLSAGNLRVLLRAIVQWKCVNCPHWWYLSSAFVRRTILRQL